ncbi:hypothetical protein FBZ99_12028 [Rhizobium sp. ERR 1071]|nr:hypothetical protein FBZ99_12028 [Rhizobium sp. ERR1071]
MLNNAPPVAAVHLPHWLARMCGGCGQRAHQKALAAEYICHEGPESLAGIDLIAQSTKARNFGRRIR